MKRWVKYGLIGEIIGLLLWAIPIFFRLENFPSLLQMPSCHILEMSFIQTLETLHCEVYYGHIANIILGIVLGVIIALVVQKLSKKDINKENQPGTKARWWGFLIGLQAAIGVSLIFMTNSLKNYSMNINFCVQNSGRLGDWESIGISCTREYLGELALVVIITILVGVILGYLVGRIIEKIKSRKNSKIKNSNQTSYPQTFK